MIQRNIGLHGGKTGLGKHVDTFIGIFVFVRMGAYV